MEVITEVNRINDLINRQYVVDALDEIESEVADGYGFQYEKWRKYFTDLPSAQPEIVRCKDCKYGEQDEVGRWFCRSLGCQIGDEDGSGFCADAERRTDEGGSG